MKLHPFIIPAFVLSFCLVHPPARGERMGYLDFEIDLVKAPGYRGIIAGLRFDPPAADATRDGVRIRSISWKPD
ncbi:MAG: hypothetical protein ACLQGP_01155 [Isosphaeraceae bacterium]